MFEQMSWGKRNRLSRIVKPDGRSLMLAIDHGYFMGSTTGMEQPTRAIAPLLPHIDALMVTPGLLAPCVDASLEAGVVLRASGGNTILAEDIDDEAYILSARQAVALNASAVAINVYVGSTHSHRTIINLTRAIEDASQYHLPVVGVTGVGKGLANKKDKRYLSHASRLLAELGADLIKTYYAEGFEEIVLKCPVPIIVAGGPRLDSYRDVLEMTYNAVQMGAIGVDMGRNIWQSDYPAAIIQGIKGILHDGLTLNEADDLVRSLCTPENERARLFEFNAEDEKLNKVH
ncbi:3-hydroxy-5-phosphonooxypentane-2,4-dione thiolase [Deinococcus sp. S9]|uniref:3-hydroxy-5-phosphonooxypentane-2,4-dione thiolase n=1 Tax=Deinococcus sp. S9 TaxID=2545754 RepID=UPI001056620A|nr:3-hydroxy-5-phosphonooxypentane-2,4-dione thiolase [Deinococcus sp. S9]TDE85036.1 3-hydroxy-5-phosphonooxypentane-2,4-dione thiolase [Deinococcus sp. S9]